MTRFALAILVTISFALHANQKWTIDAIMSSKTISDVQISPDNKTVLFVSTSAQSDGQKSFYSSTIYRFQNDACAPLSPDGVSCFQPKWSPDGKWIAFIALQDGVRHLYMISADAKNTIALVKGKKDVQTYAWSYDSSKIAYVMTDEKNSGGEINRLFVLNVFLKMPPKILTGDDICVRGNGDFGTSNVEFDWSKDSQNIVFSYSSQMSFDSFYLDSSIALVNINSGAITRWEKFTNFEAMPRFSPDDSQIAYVSNEGTKKYALVRRLAVRNVDGNNYRLLSKTPEEGAFLAGPNFLGWSQDGSFLLFYEPNGTQFHIILVPIDGSEAFSLKTGNLLIKEPSLCGQYLGFVGQKTNCPPEAFIASLDDFKPRQISSLNEHLLSYPNIKTEKISWISSDGLEIEGLLTYPLNYQEDKKYPLLLVIHGGPMAFFDETYVGSLGVYPLPVFSQEGYFIFRPNPRGSCGYGKEFHCSNFGDWGGMDFIDIMTGVKSLVEKGLADEEKLGVMGWSYGGYMTAWTITQTTQFKAASMGAGLSNLVSMNDTTDLHRFLADYLGDIEKNKDLYLERSPVNHVSNVKTPCLIQHGTADKRVPVEQSYEFYDALLQNGKEAKLTLYPDMPHRFTVPNMYEEAMLENLKWFNAYLK